MNIIRKLIEEIGNKRYFLNKKIDNRQISKKIQDLVI
jgi:hypothetical protein